MLVAIRVVGLYSLGIALIMLGNGLQEEHCCSYASIEGFSTTITGLVMTSYVGFLLRMYCHQFLANVGHIRVFAIASIASTSVCIFYTEFVNLGLGISFALMTGFAYAGLS
jgi:hypothetical protein